MSRRKKVGIVVAVEIKSVLETYGKPLEVLNVNGYVVRTYQNDFFEMYVLDSGVGEIAAAAGTQLLITKFGVDMILNFGVAGALTEHMKTAHLCVVESVVHYDFDTSQIDEGIVPGQYAQYKSPFIPTTIELVEKAVAIEPSIERVICASADKFIAKTNEKTDLNKRFGAQICEMEAAAIVLTCNRNHIPCLLIKAISDTLFAEGTDYFSQVRRVSTICFEVLDKIIKELSL